MAANLADLVDLMSYWLNNEYAKWTYDPDDPENRRAAAERKRRKVKPPPMPLIPPVAHRPPSVDEQYRKAFELLSEEFAPVLEEGRTFMTSDAFDRALGL